MKKIAAIVPAYNEEKSIAAVVAEINALALQKDLFIKVVVVNDGSKDSTADVIATLDCVALNLPINLGIGGAVQTGIKYAYNNNFDYAVQVDGDGQHPAEGIPKLIEYLENNQKDVVIGSRFIDNNGFQSTFLRRVGINYFKRLNYFLVKQTITDSTSGFRLLNKKAIELAAAYYPDEYPEPESIVYYALNGLKLGETAVNMRERNGGVSSINSFASIYYMVKVSLAIFFTFITLKLNHTNGKNTNNNTHL